MSKDGDPIKVELSVLHLWVNDIYWDLGEEIGISTMTSTNKHEETMVIKIEKIFTLRAVSLL